MNSGLTCCLVVKQQLDTRVRLRVVELGREKNVSVRTLDFLNGLVVYVNFALFRV